MERTLWWFSFDDAVQITRQWCTSLSWLSSETINKPVELLHKLESVMEEVLQFGYRSTVWTGGESSANYNALLHASKTRPHRFLYIYIVMIYHVTVAFPLFLISSLLKHAFVLHISGYYSLRGIGNYLPILLAIVIIYNILNSPLFPYIYKMVENNSC